MRSQKARETAWTGMLFALAIALSYLESLVSPLLGLMPAIKLGLSNIVVMYALLFLRTRTALLLVVLKALFAFLTRGATAGFLSLCGGALSLAVMLVLLQLPVSGYIFCAGSALAHNLGQLAGAAVLLSSAMALGYAPVLLAGDIDRGGVFAQLYGTVELLEADERARIRGLIINKFRGDVEILRPGLAMLEKKTQLPVLGVVPYLWVEIEDEDSLSDRLDTKAAVKPLDIAILRLPHVSNFTDFIPLEQHPLLGVRYVQRTRQLGAPDLVILPGTKNTMDDLRWLRESGLEAAVLRLSAAGTPVLGVCGGYQMLGEQLCDPAGEESGTPCTLRGLGLLPTTTVFGTEKHLTQTAACVTTEPFAGAKLTGYEIHAGRTEVRGSAFCILADGTPEGCVQDGVFGTYLHGLFDTGELTEKLTAFLCKRKGIDPAGAELIPMEQYRQQQFDLLADGVRAALDMPAIYAAMGMQKGDNT